jgi:O6-methylguanine-DNA--protein-cysteine methyltransferase
MQVEWTTYSSPIGALTVVECETGPLVVEFPHRTADVKWAVRLRSAIPELHIGQGPCRITSAWLDEYFAGSPRAFPFPEHLRHWFELSPAQVSVFKTLRKIPLGETRSYDDIARATRLHPRQIGWLVAANHLAILIPWTYQEFCVWAILRLEGDRRWPFRTSYSINCWPAVSGPRTSWGRRVSLPS